MPSAFTVQTPEVATIRALNYSPILKRFRKRRGKDTIRLGDVLASTVTGYGTVFARVDCDPSFGVELLSQTDAFASEPAGRVIRVDSMTRPERHRVKLWQILIAGVGTLAETELYGRAVIAESRLAGKHLSQDVLALTATEPGSVESLYLYAFLCTPTGVSLMRSTSYGTKMLRLRRSTVSEICVPDASPTLKERVAKLVRTAAEQRGQYLHEIREARRIIEALPEAEEALSQCQDRKARCSIASGPFTTIAARNHAALGTARVLLAKLWKSRLADLLEQDGIYNGPRFARTPCTKPYGIDFLDQRDVFAIRPVSRRIVEPRISKRQLYVPSHALIVASHGQVVGRQSFRARRDGYVRAAPVRDHTRYSACVTET